MLLLDNTSVTKEIMLREDLVGIVRGTSIEIVKNNITNELGTVPFAEYIRIANTNGPVSYEDLFSASETSDHKKAHETSEKKSAQTEEEYIQETAKSFFKDLSDVFKQVAEDVKGDLDKVAEDVNEDVERFKEHVQPDIEKAVKGLHNLLKKADVQAEILRLQSVKKFAEEEDISTKGFVKKVDAKIAVLKALV